MFFRRLSEGLLKHRLKTLGLLGALTLLAALQLPKLRFDFQPSAMMQFSDEEKHFEEVFNERFHVSDNLLLIIIESDEKDAITTKYGLSLLRALTTFSQDNDISTAAYSITEVPRLPPLSESSTDTEGPDLGLLKNTQKFFSKTTRALSGIVPTPLVPSLPVKAIDVARVKEQISRSSMLKGNLVSADGRTGLVIIEVAEKYQKLEVLMPKLEAFQKEIKGLVYAPPFADEVQGRAPPFEVYFGGLPQVRSETVRLLKRDQTTFWPLVGLIFFVLMLWFFRRLVQASLPLITVGLATLWIVGLLAVIGQEINILNNIIPTLILVVGICDGLHVVIRTNTLRRAGATSMEAAKGALSDLGFPCLLTSLTTAIGFASLTISRSDVLQNFGWQVAVGIMMAYIAIITAVPTLTSLLRKPLPPTVTTDDGEEDGWLERFIDRLTIRVLDHPVRVVVAALILFAGCIAVGVQVPIDARVLDTFNEGHPVHDANLRIEEQLGGILLLEVELDGGAPGRFREPDALQRAADLQAHIETLDGVLATTSVLDLLSEARLISTGEASDWRDDAGRLSGLLSLLKMGGPDGMQLQYLTEDERYMRITARMKDQGGAKTLEAIKALQAQSNQLLNPEGSDRDLKMHLTGVAYLSAVGLDAFVRDLVFSLATASLVIFLVLMVVFKSPRVGLISILPNIMPLAITLALMPVYGYDLNTSSAIIFTIGIGLSVDNTIHFLARFFEKRSSHDNLRDTIRAAFRSAGRAIVVSNVFLCAGFSALYLSDFEPSQRVAILTVTAISSSMIVAIILLPALLFLLKPKGIGSGAWSKETSPPEPQTSPNPS